MAINKIINDLLTFLKKQPLIIATAIIGVKFGGCGIKRVNANNKITLIGNISCDEILKTLFIYKSLIH